MKKWFFLLTLLILGCPRKHRVRADLSPISSATNTKPERLLIGSINPNLVVRGPIAVGAKFDLPVFNDDNRKKWATVESAQFEDQEIAVVSKIVGHIVTVEGISAGSSKLTVRRKDGEIGTLALNFVNVDQTRLIHACLKPGEDAFAHYVAGTQNVPIFYAVGARAFSPELFGYGYTPFELTEGAQFTEKTGDFSTSGHRYLNLDIGAKTGEVLLTSKIDDEKLVISIVEEHDFDGIERDEETTSQVPTSLVKELVLPQVISIGSRNVARFHPTVDGVRVCGVVAAVEFQTLTPEICNAQASRSRPLRSQWHTTGRIRGRWSPDDWILGRTGVVVIEGKSAGNCVISVSYPGGMAGAQQFKSTFKVVDKQ